MTRFEKDMNEALAGNEIEVLKRRNPPAKPLSHPGNKARSPFLAGKAQRDNLDRFATLPRLDRECLIDGTHDPQPFEKLLGQPRNVALAQNQIS